MGTLTARDRIAIETARTKQRQAGRVNLQELAERNLTGRRERLTREGKARRAAELRRITPAAAEPVKPSDVPVTFKAERPKRRRVERPAKSIWEAATGEPAPVKAEPAPTDYQPIKAAELDKEMKAAAKRILQSDTSGGWRLIGVMNRESGRVKVYVRKHGASVRYSTAA
ncbi:hypothetical protein ACWDFH_26255 [Streptomyces kronopolitis]